MSHSLIKRAAAGASRIDITQLKDLKYWSYKLGCSVEQLRAAIKSVGDDAAAVTNYFLRVATFKQAMAA